MFAKLRQQQGFANDRVWKSVRTVWYKVSPCARTTTQLAYLRRAELPTKIIGENAGAEEETRGARGRLVFERFEPPHNVFRTDHDRQVLHGIFSKA